MSPNRIVIAGTIASGKSTLSKIISDLGYEVIDSDKVNRELLEKGNKNYQAIKNSGLFDEAFDKDVLDKKKLAEIIFKDSKKRSELNKISHKNILEEIKKRIDKSNDKYIFIEMPLYFSIMDKFKTDQVWLLDAKKDVQLERLMKRDNISLDYAKRKLESQENKDFMIKNSDIVFDNSKDILSLEKQVVEKLKNMEKKDEVY